MLSQTATYLAMILTVAAIAVYAIVVSRKLGVDSVTTFFSAKNSTDAFRLAWCFFASGMGSWTLFSFPEIGVLAGSWGVIGYTLSGIIGMVVIALVGPYSRKFLGDGVTLTDYLYNRFGRVMQMYVAAVSIFYQFISLASELTSVGDLASILTPGAHPVVPIVGVAVITNIYLAIGGLRASMATDVWQAMGVLALVLLVCVVMFVSVDIPDNAWEETNVAAFTVNGFEALVTLCIAVGASNLFFTGYWQRVFAAQTDATLHRACIYASCMIIPFTVALAIAGMVSYLVHPDGTYFFSILFDLGRAWQVVIAVVIASVASSVSDSLQMGMAAELVTNFPQLSLLHARLVCVLLTIPAIFIALEHYDIINLFLIADVLCTATVGPMVLAAWPRATSLGAISGCISGLLTIFICGCVVRGSFVGGFEWFILPEGLYSQNSMITFILALFVPILTTIGVSLMKPDKAQRMEQETYALTHTPMTMAA